MSMPPIASTTRTTPIRSTISTASIGRPVSVRTTDRTAPIPLTAPRPGHSPGLRRRRLDVHLVEQPCLAAARRGVASGTRRVRRVLEVARQADHRHGARLHVHLDQEHHVVATAPAPAPASEPISSRSKRPSSPHGSAPRSLPGDRRAEGRERPVAAVPRIGRDDRASARGWVRADGARRRARCRPAARWAPAGSVGSGIGVSTTAVPGSGSWPSSSPAKVSSRNDSVARIVSAASRWGTPTASTMTRRRQRHPQPARIAVADRVDGGRRPPARDEDVRGEQEGQGARGHERGGDAVGPPGQRPDA